MKSMTKRLRNFLLLIPGFLLALSITLAQGTPAEQLSPGDPVTGFLSSTSLAQIYLFTGSQGDVVELQATSRDGVLPAILLTDISGRKLAEDGDTDEAGIVNLTAILPGPGTYYVTVFNGPGAVASEGEFELTLVDPDAAVAVTDPEPTATMTPTEEIVEATEAVVEETPPPTATPTTEPVVEPDDNLVGGEVVFQPSQDVLITGGMRVDLNWATAVDLNLEVRDPQGNTVYFEQTTSPIGAQFGPDSNGQCNTVIPTPAENITWSQGFLPSGNYEILVYYVQTCDTTISTTDFTLTVTVGGEVLAPIEGRLAPPVGNNSSVYIAGFTVLPDGTAGNINEGGIYPDSAIDEPVAPIAEIAAVAGSITRDIAEPGTIAGLQYYEAFSFEGIANESISASLIGTAGNLDTLLQVIDSTGRVVDANDDSGDTRDSAVTNVRLLNTGTYYLVTTRYGKDLGSTEGEFVLTLTGPTETVSQVDLTSLGLPEGDTQVLLTWNTNADLQLLVRDPVGESVFDDNPQVGSGGILEVNGNVDCTVTSTSPVSYIYWPTGFLRPGTYEIEIWFQQNCNDTTAVQFDLTTIVDGEFVISERRNPVLDSRYVVSFDIAADGSTTVRPGGFIGVGTANIPFASQVPTAAEVGQSWSGSILQSDFVDVYTLDAVAGQLVTINMTASPGSTLDTRVILLTPDGQLAAENDDVEPGVITNSSITSFQIPFDGTYTIVATRYAGPYGGTTGDYSLVIGEG